MRVELAEAIVLHRRSWRETSLIVDAFAREHGRVALVAKGARRPRGRWRGLLEPLARLELSWSGRGDMGTLTDAQPQPRAPLAGDRLMAGLYASELVLRLTARDDPHPALFDSLAALLAVLADGAPAVIALRFFERDVLAALGYGLDLAHAADTGAPIVAARRYHFDAAAGTITESEAGEAVTLGGRALLGLAAGRFVASDDVREARALLRAALAPLLGDRPLRSATTLAAMRRFARGGARHTISEEGNDGP